MYSILVSYANKNNSPFIGINTFLEFLDAYAKKLSAENPEWVKWTKGASVNFWSEMSGLVEEGKCELFTDSPDGRIYMVNFYPHRIKKSYQAADADADLPFHNEESLRIEIPETQVKNLDSNQGLIGYMDKPQGSDTPILRIKFPDGFDSALVLASMIPRQLSEISLLKIRNYLRKGGNREYILHKVLPQLKGRESGVRDQFNKVLIRPFDCYKEIEAGGEFSNLFWTYFCIAVRHEIKKKKELMHEDIAATQSCCIIESINIFYKNKAIKRQQTELAFRSLEIHLQKPPFLYTLDQICKFTSAKGILLLTQYTEDDLVSWIKKKTTETTNNELPVLLYVCGNRYYVLKEKIPALCVKLLTEARDIVRDVLGSRWKKLLREFESEIAMKDNEEFERTLRSLTGKYCPILSEFLGDPNLWLAYSEAERSSLGVPSTARIFSGDKLLPYSLLLLLNRKDFLFEMKLLLPFWYSIPIISSLIVFFKKMGGKKKTQKKNSQNNEDQSWENVEENTYSQTISYDLQEIKRSLIPQGRTTKSYMEELEEHWALLIDKQARKYLIDDVKSLIKDHLKRAVRTQRRLKISREAIGQMSRNIVANTPSFASIGNRESLITYTEVYLVSLLESGRFANFK